MGMKENSSIITPPFQSKITNLTQNIKEKTVPELFVVNSELVQE